MVGSVGNVILGTDGSAHTHYKDNGEMLTLEEIRAEIQAEVQARAETSRVPCHAIILDRTGSPFVHVYSQVRRPQTIPLRDYWKVVLGQGREGQGQLALTNL